MKKKVNENTKVTLTLDQLKRLVKESFEMGSQVRVFQGHGRDSSEIKPLADEIQAVLLANGFDPDNIYTTDNQSAYDAVKKVLADYFDQLSDGSWYLDDESVTDGRWTLNFKWAPRQVAEIRIVGRS